MPTTSKTHQLKNSQTSPPHLPMPICQQHDGYPLLAQALHMKLANGAGLCATEPVTPYYIYGVPNCKATAASN